MDQIFEAIFNLMPYLHIIAGIAFILKMIIVFKNKGFNIEAVFVSFFRIYTVNDRNMTSSASRQQFMKLNNYLNYYLYVWALITIIILVVFQRLY